MTQAKFDTLKQIVEKSRNLVFFGGAGVSTESGIPDFRSSKGLYTLPKSLYGYSPEEIVSHDFYAKHKEDFFAFYRERILILDVEPNSTHHTLAALEKTGHLRAVITQNIDGLHQKAGSQEVLELHGSIHRNFCTRCGKGYTAEQIQVLPTVPFCDCGGNIKPDVVLFGEPLDSATMERALDHIEQADTLIVGGTSLAVYPAAGFLRYFRGSKLIIINRDETPSDKEADLVFRESLGSLFTRLDQALALSLPPTEAPRCDP
ncbi:MAG: NAD-dependent protein deacylase [Coriobacteriales bacterium]|jgi:NAD-dependent deacetylase|nr:NAD-dependent protein deacylase [Coriobacteriales bacterium]